MQCVACSALQLSALRDDDWQLRFVVRSRGHVLNAAYCEHAVDDLAEHDVLVVQPLGLGARDEKLAAVRVGTWRSERDEQPGEWVSTYCERSHALPSISRVSVLVYLSLPC